MSELCVLGTSVIVDLASVVVQVWEPTLQYCILKGGTRWGEGGGGSGGRGEGGRGGGCGRGGGVREGGRGEGDVNGLILKDGSGAFCVLQALPGHVWGAFCVQWLENDEVEGRGTGWPSRPRTAPGQSRRPLLSPLAVSIRASTYPQGEPITSKA